ncbi:MAG: KH domain-containing protein [Candidatus Margulisbacteria bacterium]|nr:KH domain-containing protein [Candidatus Margulisiibacteriota bacterium]
MKKDFMRFFKGFSGKPKGQSEEDVKQKEFAMNQNDEEEFEIIEENTQEKIKKDPFLFSDEIVDFCTEKLNEILSNSEFDCAVKVTEKYNDVLWLDIESEESVGLLIGREGSTLEALQVILVAMVHKSHKASVKVILDAGGYRLKREESLKQMAKKAAQSALKRSRPVPLKPMCASERRVVHLLFQGHDKVRTYSKGQGSGRHVVLEWKSA